MTYKCETLLIEGLDNCDSPNNIKDFDTAVLF